MWLVQKGVVVTHKPRAQKKERRISTLESVLLTELLMKKPKKPATKKRGEMPRKSKLIPLMSDWAEHSGLLQVLFRPVKQGHGDYTTRIETDGWWKINGKAIRLYAEVYEERGSRVGR